MLESDPLITSAINSMPVCKALIHEYSSDKPFKERIPLLNTHVTIETAVAAHAFLMGGATNVVVCSTAYGTDEHTYKLLKKKGIPVFARPKGEKGLSEDKCLTFLEAALSAYPVDGLIDDGGRYPTLLKKSEHKLGEELVGVVEQTRGGEICWNELFGKSLPLPVISVNSSPFKKIEHKATAQTVISASMSAIKGDFAGRTVAIIGFGEVGREIALQLMKEHGARVIVVDKNPLKLVIAHKLGCQITTKESALKEADIIVTATGNLNIIARDNDFYQLKNGCFLVNAGRHGEIDVAALEKLALIKHAIRTAPESLTQYLIRTSNGEKSLYLVGCGFPVNIYVGSGNPKEVLDLIFALMMECLRYIYDNEGKLQNKLIPAPKECIEKVARLYLKAHGYPVSV